MFVQHHLHCLLDVDVRVHQIALDDVAGDGVLVLVFLQIGNVFFFGITVPKLVANWVF